MNIFTRLSQEIIVSDGAMGTMLQAAGLPRGVPPEIWNITHPDKIKEVHKAYISAGAQIITTNTFGANRAKLKEYNLDKDIKLINQRAVEIARSVAKDDTIVAGSIGPTGKFLKPFGELTFDEAYAIFSEQAMELQGVDVIMIETMIDSLEMRAAIIGVRNATSLPIIAQFSFNEGTRTVTGTDAKTACAILDGLEVAIFGANCGSTLQDTTEVIRLMVEETDSFLIVQPNVGIGKTIASPNEVADFAVKVVDLGVNIVGSCCGSTPEYTKSIANAVMGKKPKIRKKPFTTSIASRTRVVYIGDNAPLLVVGERINPSGKPKLKEQMRQMNIEGIKSEAIKQVECGVQALDINIGNYNHQLMAQLIEALQTAVQVPLFIDSQDPATIEGALKVYGGKGVVNSINGREDLCAKILPIAKQYGAAVVGLTIDEQGIPETPEARLEVARKIIKLANSYGVKDIIIDPLVLPIGSYEKGAYITIEALKKIKQELGVPTILGISNISFGLPGREFINQAFLIYAIQAGLDVAILDPFEPRLMELISAAEVLAGKDHKAQKYISKYTLSRVTVQESHLHPIQKSVLAGNKEEVANQVNILLQSNMPPLKIINELLIPAMDEVSKRYENKEIFLPQLIGASEAVKEGINIITPFLGKSESKGKKLLIATVEGDMHDLGKNLVKSILEANGYEVIDLGKDVKPTRILEVCKAESPNIVGLSCLMTTTLPALEETVKYLHSEYPEAKIIVGGASVDEEFATKIGAYYAKDAISAVNLLNSL